MMTVRSGIHGEMAMAGTRMPDRSKVNPYWPAGPDGSRGRDRGRGDVVVGAAMLVEADHEQRVVDVGPGG